MGHSYSGIQVGQAGAESATGAQGLLRCTDQPM